MNSKNDKLIANRVPRPEDNRSIMERISELPEDDRQKTLDVLIEKYCDGDPSKLKFQWELWRRGNQWMPEHDDWRTLCFLAGRGFGKLLNINTLLPTPTGWVLMKDIKVGDTLFDEQGKTCKVTEVFPIQNPKKAYRMHFSDNSYLEAGDEHFWSTWTRYDRRIYQSRFKKTEKGFPKNWVNYTSDTPKVLPKIDYTKICKIRTMFDSGETYYKITKETKVDFRTIKKLTSDYFDLSPYIFGTYKSTEEIAATINYENGINDKNPKNRHNHCIPQTFPLCLPEQELLIHPYLLGLFISDGTTGSSRIATDVDDYAELVKILPDLGYSCGKLCMGNRTFAVFGLISNLKKIGVIKKHIPEQYLRGSFQQRLNLLQGLMDGDGSVCKDGTSCTFKQVDDLIASQVYELIISLGMKATINKYPASIGDVKYRDQNVIKFTAIHDVFKLARKLARLRMSENNTMDLKRYYRSIIKIEEIENIEMRCISVDSPNAMYLVGKEMIPTRNTRVGAELTRYMVETEQVRRVGIIAPTAHDATAVVLYGESGLMNISPPHFRPTHHPTYKKISWPNGAVAYLFALDLNTEIPTPKGFKKLEDVHVGDQIFDEDGRVCNVTYETPTMFGNKCYELTFKNGQKIICDKDHLWRISTLNDRYLEYNKGNSYKYRTVNTEYIANNLRENNKHNDLNNWIRLTKSVQYQEKELPIPSYVLGIWLSDGDKNSGMIASADLEIPEEIKKYGYRVSHNEKYPIVWYVSGLITQLKKLDLYRNKHIPDIYKYSSVQQRLELLQGLFDGDGTVGKTGEITFTNTNENLVDGVCEIVASLGGWTTKILCKPRKNNPWGGPELPIWKVSIRKVENCFRLPRKLKRMKNRRRYFDIPIVDVKEVVSVPVKCIKVDSDSSLFLASRSYLPTHNSAEDPESLRGHAFDWIWGDEGAAWTRGLATWQQAMLTLRIGKKPRAIVTTTPKANELIKSIVANKKTWTITGSTYENSSNIYIEEMTSMFEGTRLGKQELHGEILSDIDGAMFKQIWIDNNRVSLKSLTELPDFLYIVIAVDPAMTANKNSDYTGICVAAYATDDNYYILYADSIKETPLEWAKKVLDLYDDFVCGSIVAEVNQGGDLVVNNLKQMRPNVVVNTVHAKFGKALRAEPVCHLVERGKIKHVGFFPRAEDELTTFNPVTNPGGSSDITDAYVYACLYLMDRATVSAIYSPQVGGMRQKLLSYRVR